MVKTLTAKGHVDEMECRLKKKDGSIIDCLTSLRLYPDQGVLEGSIIDITERKRMEKELQNAQKLESLGVLAGGIAHDFNNLMGGIFGYIDLALEECDDPKISRYLAKTMNTIERARGLTQQLLTFSTGGSPIRKLDDLFPFIQETVQFALSGSNVSCGFKVAKDLRSCNFDKNQIGQVIDNIVINAQQAMPSGGAMEISAENISFTEKKHPALSGGEYVRISIKDHGVGIPKEICRAFSTRSTPPKPKATASDWPPAILLSTGTAAASTSSRSRVKAARFMYIYPPRKTPRLRRRPPKS